MKNICFSFIIPHKNNPTLLQRCVNSIPSRDDIQIIIVDDNSDPKIVDWNALKFNASNLDIVFAKENKGAGYARNIGIKHAEGKWLLFADCDDYYLPSLSSELDKVKEQSYDVIYFNFELKSADKQKVYGGHKLVSQKILTNQTADYDFIKYRLNAPWNKIVNHTFLKKHRIYFEETIQGNDMFFTYQVGYFSKNIHIISKPLYVYNINLNSITFGKTNIDKLLCMIKGLYKANNFMLFIGHPEWRVNVKFTILRLLKKHPSMSFLFLTSLIKESRNIRMCKTYYVDSIKNRRFEV